MAVHNFENEFVNIWIDHTRHVHGHTSWDNKDDAQRNAEALRKKGYFVYSLDNYTGPLEFEYAQYRQVQVVDIVEFHGKHTVKLSDGSSLSYEDGITHY